MSTPTWAKAPDFATDRHRAESVRAQTDADKRTYLESGMAPVTCTSCGTCVLVRKNSYKHTSIQWTSDPSSCTELSGPHDYRASCARLGRNIEHAVLEGLLTVDDPDAE